MCKQCGVSDLTIAFLGVKGVCMRQLVATKDCNAEGCLVPEQRVLPPAEYADRLPGKMAQMQKPKWGEGSARARVATWSG